MVTVELAIGTVTLTVLVAALVSLIMLGVTQAGAAESSAQIARQLARGDERAVEAAKQRAPGKVIEISRDGGIEVIVEATSFVLGIGNVPVKGATWMAYEPGEEP